MLSCYVKRVRSGKISMSALEHVLGVFDADMLNVLENKTRAYYLKHQFSNINSFDIICANRFPFTFDNTKSKRVFFRFRVKM